MFHLLSEYAKLLTFKPTIPRNATELCSEIMACPAEGTEKKFMMESLVKVPEDAGPCTLPSPYDPSSLLAVIRKKATAIKVVRLWEKKFWQHQTK